MSDKHPDPENPAARLRRLVGPHAAGQAKRLTPCAAGMVLAVLDLRSTFGRKVADALAGQCQLHNALAEAEPEGVWRVTVSGQQLFAAAAAVLAPPAGPRELSWAAVLVDDDARLTVGRLSHDGTLRVGESDPEPPTTA